MPHYLVLGAGAWGTSLALHLSRHHHPVTLWTRDPLQAERLSLDRENRKYLPGFPFPSPLSISQNLSHALYQADRILFTVPSHAFAETLELVALDYPKEKGILWATKGLDPLSGKFLGDRVKNILGSELAQGLLTGPSFAREVAQAEPTEVNLATNNLVFGREIQRDFEDEKFQIVLIDDILGAEIGGAVKNVVSITVGIAEGLGYGMNTKAMLMNKGIHEMRRFASSLGANPETLLGPCGIGDLILTCSDNQSRNRRWGLMVGQGQSPQMASLQIAQVVEGIKAAETLHRLAEERNIYAPIISAVHAFMEKPEHPRDLIETLLKG